MSHATVIPRNLKGSYKTGSTVFVRYTNSMARWMNLLDLGRSLDSDDDEFSVLESGEDVRVAVRDGDALDLNVKRKRRDRLQSETQP